MPTVRDILAIKGSQVYTIAASATVLEAVQEMNEHGIGALVVAEEGLIVGILTERDVLHRVVAHQYPVDQVQVGQVMTDSVICCSPDQDIDEASRIMRDRLIRHLPVCEGDALVGLISIGDINACHASEQEATIQFLSDYIYGRA